MRWAIIGTGFISNTVIDAIRLTSTSTVEVLAGRSPERLAELAEAKQIIRTTTDIESAVRDPRVEAVYIGLPNHLHHEVALTASGAGKVVLSEKSLTTTMDTAHALVDGVRANGTFFAEGLMYLAHPVIERFVELLLDGRVGTVQSIHGRYAAPIAHLVNPDGMGTLYNLGCYPVSLLQLVIQTAFGHDMFRDRTAWGVGNVSELERNVVDAALAVRFANGTLATVQSTDNYGMHHDFSVTGDNGVLRFDTTPWLPTAGSNIIMWEPFDGSPERIEVLSEHDAFVHQIHMVERLVAAGRTQPERPSPTLTDSIEIMEMLTEWESDCRKHADD